MPDLTVEPARIDRARHALPPGYEVAPYTGAPTPLAVWGLAGPVEAQPVQCVELAAPPVRPDSAQGWSASGPGGIVYAVVLPCFKLWKLCHVRELILAEEEDALSELERKHKLEKTHQIWTLRIAGEYLAMHAALSELAERSSAVLPIHLSLDPVEPGVESGPAPRLWTLTVWL